MTTNEETTEINPTVVAVAAFGAGVLTAFAAIKISRNVKQLRDLGRETLAAQRTVKTTLVED